MSRAAYLPVLGVACLLGLAGGCESPMPELREAYAEQGAKLDAAEERVADLEEANRKLRNRADAQQERIETLQALGDRRIEQLFTVDRIELGQYTGGLDTDDEPGHDALKVYLLPQDAAGSTIKAAGDVTIRMYDLASPAGEELLAEYTWPAGKLGEHWSSSLMTYHFSFVCPWKDRPAHDEITVRVEFIDYLTGKRFTAQKLCEVDLPPAP